MDVYTRALNTFADFLNGVAFLIRKLTEVLSAFA